MQAFLEEFAGYRAELAAPYLTDVRYTEKLVEETYRRMKLEVNASHLLIIFPQNATPEDTLQAWQRIHEIRKEIVDGLDFNEAAARYSQDPSAAQNRGYLGWFTAFQMVAPFEDAAYSTPIGQLSPAIKTRFGYHLLKVHDQREAKGEIKVAHIMKMFTPEMSPERKALLKLSVDSLYSMLQKGADFAQLARDNSEDQRSAVNGGEMPYFSRSRMIPEFSDPAFELKNNGDFTRPVETDFGYHIIKRLDLQEIPDFEEIRRELEDRIRRDPERSTRSREVFINKLKEQYAFSRNQAAADRKSAELKELFKDGLLNIPDEMKDAEVLFTMDGRNFTMNEWLDYLRTIQVNITGDPESVMESQYNLWEEYAIIQYEDDRLEQKYPEFRSLVQEYHDGLLLFAISEKEIWQKAADDTTGLQSFYQQNKSKYMWNERYKGMIIRCANPDLKEIVEEQLDQGIPADEIFDLIDIDENQVTLEQGTWSKGDNAIIDYYIWSGTIPDGWNPESGFVRGETIGPEPKLLGEARGYHISDYQQYLEEQWIKELRRKYPVKVNKKVLRTI
jgi:peptidyl-prolyl cis-trans isomerase SurA